VKPRHSISSLAVVAAVALFLSGCGGSNSSSGSTSTSTSASHPTSGGTSSSAVKISNFKFVPASVTAKQGAGVSVTNNDSTAHTATADDGKSFDTGDINPGSSATITVAKAGSYPYHCSIHPFMHGTLTVK
jgi:plastocyanin